MSLTLLIQPYFSYSSSSSSSSSSPFSSSSLCKLITLDLLLVTLLRLYDSSLLELYSLSELSSSNDGGSIYFIDSFGRDDRWERDCSLGLSICISYYYLIPPMVF